MRRRTRLALLLAVLLLAVVGGAYTAFWFIAAGNLKDELVQWADAARARKVDARWHELRVGGFPFAFSIELTNASLRDEAINPAAEIHMPRFFGRAHAWNFGVWHLTAPQGLNAAAGPKAEPFANLAAPTATGTVWVSGDGSTTVWLGLDAPRLESGEQLGASTADFWLMLPPGSPAMHTESNFALAADLRELSLPPAPGPFSNLLDELAFGITVKGAIPSGPARQAATAWRDEGGTAEVDNFTLRWGQVAVTGSGTLALDNNLQPIGGFSGAVEGYEELISALVATGRMKASDARLARIGLALLAKAGPDGRPAITTSLTIQNSEMFLGPAKLGPVPKINWE